MKEFLDKTQLENSTIQLDLQELILLSFCLRQTFATYVIELHRTHPDRPHAKYASNLSNTMCDHPLLLSSPPDQQRQSKPWLKSGTNYMTQLQPPK